MKFLKTDFKPPKSKKGDISNQFWIKIPPNTPIYSSEVQRLLFGHGYTWADGDTEAKHLDRPLLWVYKNQIYVHGDITYQKMLRQPQVWICDKTAPCYNYVTLTRFLNN